MAEIRASFSGLVLIWELDVAMMAVFRPLLTLGWAGFYVGNVVDC